MEETVCQMGHGASMLSPNPLLNLHKVLEVLQIPTVLVFMETVTQERLIQLLATGDSPVIRSLQHLSFPWRPGGGTECQTHWQPSPILR